MSECVCGYVLACYCCACSLQGHLLLIGVSGAGKTTLSRFVAWINGLTVFQIKVSRQGETYENLKNAKP